MNHTKAFKQLCDKRMAAGAQEHGDFDIKSPAEFWLSNALEELADLWNYLHMADDCINRGFRQRITAHKYKIFFKAAKPLILTLAQLIYSELNRKGGRGPNGYERIND